MPALAQPTEQLSEQPTDGVAEPVVLLERRVTYHPTSPSPSPAPPSGGGAQTCVGCVGALHWWRCQPSSLLWWGATIQLGSAAVFEVACAAGLPGILTTRDMERAFVHLPSLVGSLGFTFASYVYLMEVTHSANPLRRPAELSMGYAIAVINLVGSVLYTVASAFYFAPAEAEASPDEPAPYDTGYYYSEWGVRFLYGLGSLCFTAGAALSFPEMFSG